MQFLRLGIVSQLSHGTGHKVHRIPVAVHLVDCEIRRVALLYGRRVFPRLLQQHLIALVIPHPGFRFAVRLYGSRYAVHRIVRVGISMDHRIFTGIIFLILPEPVALGGFTRALHDLVLGPGHQVADLDRVIRRDT